MRMMTKKDLAINKNPSNNNNPTMVKSTDNNDLVNVELYFGCTFVAEKTNEDKGRIFLVLR